MRVLSRPLVVSSLCLCVWDSADAQSTARIRTVGARLTGVVAEAPERSRTFRELVEHIEASDGIVYIEPGGCRGGARACVATVSVAGSSRLLRVRVETDRPDWDLMGAIGHELRHVIEVLSSPAVTSSSAMYFFYRREGRSTEFGFETEAAIQAGNAVREEAQRAARRR